MSTKRRRLINAELAATTVVYEIITRLNKKAGNLAFRHDFQLHY